MARLDTERQQRLEPTRMEYAIKKLTELGFTPEKVGGTQLTFIYKGATIRLFPYSGWHTGKTIQDGRGIEKLLKQLQ